MASDELTVIVDQLNKQGKMAFLERATEDQIVLAAIHSPFSTV